jgi:hypothetical protein
VPYAGLIRPQDKPDRLILGRALGRRLLQAHGDRVLAIALVGRDTAEAAPFAPMRLAAVMVDGPVAGRQRVVDGTVVHLGMAPKDHFLATAGTVDLDWTVRGPLFHAPLVLFEAASHLIDIARAEAEREAHTLGPALADAFAGPVAAAVADLAPWLDDPDPATAVPVLAPFAWTVARTVALANGHVFADPAAWASETRELPRRPAEWDPFLDAWTGRAEGIGEAATALVEALPGFAASLGAPLDDRMPEF